jgi:hypothetical protein
MNGWQEPSGRPDGLLAPHRLIPRAHRRRRPRPKYPSTARITITMMTISRMPMVRSLPLLSDAGGGAGVSGARARCVTECGNSASGGHDR